MKTKHKILSALLLVSGVLPCTAADTILASDEASNSPYAPSEYRPITSGVDNGGSGFGAWTFVSNEGNFFTHNENRSLDPPQIHKTPASELLSTGGRFFLMWHNNDGTSTASRSITGGLQVGQTFSMYLDHGWVDYGRMVGLRMTDPSNTQQMAFDFLGGDGGGYRIHDGTGTQNATHGWTPAGMKLSFTLTSTSTYTFSVYFLDNNTTETFTGSLTNENGIGGFQIFSGQQYGGWERDIYVNKFEVRGDSNSSNFRITDVQMLSENTQIQLSVEGLTIGKTYRVSDSTELTGFEEIVGSDFVADATTRNIILEVTPGTVPKRFFRVQDVP